MIGERADSELTEKIKQRINSYAEAQGTYDLNLHYYGPQNIIGSAHIQVRDEMTAKEIHSLTRMITYDIYNEFGIVMSLGIYAANDQGEYGDIKKRIEEICKDYKEVIQVHGFYVEESMKKIFFDLIIDFKVENQEKIKDEIVEKLKKEFPEYDYNVILDADITD